MNDIPADMEKQIDNIFESAKSAVLSDSERAQMRGQLSAFISEHPAQAPFRIRVAERLISYARTLSHGGMRPLSAAFALVLVVGIGTSYAAEGALPGDRLYPIKMHINETLAGSLAVSEVSEAKWQTTLIERRLSEAEALVARDALSMEAQQHIQGSLNNAARSFDANVYALAQKKNTTAIAEAQSTLEASLKGHERVLATLIAKKPDAAPAAAGIVSRVRTRAAVAENSRVNAEATLAANFAQTSEIKEAAIEKKNDATESLGDVRLMLAVAEDVGASSTSEAASTSAEEAEIAILVGDEELQAGEYGSAFSAFQAAIREAQQAEVHLDAAVRLETDIDVGL